MIVFKYTLSVIINLLGESFINTQFYLYCIFSLIPQVTNVFDFNVQTSQPAKSSIQDLSTKNSLFSSTSTYLTLDLLLLVIVSTLFYIY